MAATIGIIGALDKEVAQVYEALDNGTVTEQAGLRIARGTYRGVNVVATTAGMGTVNVAAATQLLISSFGATTVIFSGIAGGLNPALHIDDVVIGAHLRYIDTDTALIAESAPGLEEFASTPALVSLAQEMLEAHGFVDALAADAGEGAGAAPADEPRRYLVGTIATGDRFITGDGPCADVFAATQADCAEMEGAAVAHIAAKNGVNCLVLRAISDNCDEEYDAFCERSFEVDAYARTASTLVLSLVDRIAQAQ